MTRARARRTPRDADELAPSTRWYRARGRPSLRDKAIKQQVLTPAEEKALAQYVLRMAHNGYPLPAKLLCSLAAIILRNRAASSNGPKACQAVRCPRRNWALAFLRRHPELKARRVKAVDWKRHDHNIYDKTKEWFDIIGKELRAPDILQENVYNMDETGTLLSAPKSLRVLVGRDDLRNYRGAGVQRTLVTAISWIPGHVMSSLLPGRQVGY